MQGRISREDREGLLDDITGGGFTLIARSGAPLMALAAGGPGRAVSAAGA